MSDQVRLPAADVMNGVSFSSEVLFRVAPLPLLGPPAERAISWLAARALARPADLLRRALPAFPAASKDLEQRYLGLGEALEDLARIARELVSGARRVVVMAAGKETGEADFERTLAVLRCPMEFLSLALVELPEVAASLRRAAAQAGRLVALEQGLEQTLAPLRFTQLMFSVESAALSDQARESFGALTCQIGALHQRVQVSLRQHFDALIETRDSLTRAVEELERFSAQRMRDLEQRRAQIAETLSHLAEEVRANARRDVQLSSAGDGMAAEVNRAVTAMQTQDIVAQKLEHAGRGLAEVLQAVKEIEHREGVQCLRRVATVARIELAQLDAVSTELARSQKLLGDAIGGIEARLGEMDSQCLMLHQFQNITASVDGTAQVLIDSVAGVRDMTADTLRITRRLEEILRPVESAAGIVTGSVSEVAAEIHRIALNAQVHAVQTGGRTGLEVLAEHIAGLAGDTLRINAQLCAGLAESVGEMTASTARLARLRQSGEEAARVSTVDAAREEASLHGFRDRVLAEMHQVGAGLDQAREKSARMLTALDLDSTLQHIRGARRTVEQLVSSTEAMLPPQDAIDRHREAAHLSRRYTMDSERQTHHEVLRSLRPDAASPSPVAAPSAEPATAPEEANELGAGIELF